jgi:hypothetical protein
VIRCRQRPLELDAALDDQPLGIVGDIEQARRQAPGHAAGLSNPKAAKLDRPELASQKIVCERAKGPLDRRLADNAHDRNARSLVHHSLLNNRIAHLYAKGHDGY